MENILEDKLRREIRNGDLKGNRLASVLLDIVKTGRFFKASRRELAAELVASPMPKNLFDDKEDIREKGIVSDLRFLAVTLAGIKKFPVRKDSLNFGLLFSKENKPVNTILVGSNGIGKTSVYSALEYAGMRKLNTAAARGYDRKIGQASDKSKNPKEDQSAFLIHAGTDRKDVSLRLFTKDREINLQGEKLFELYGKPEITEAFYCSDFDVRELENKDDYTRFLLRQVGLNHVYHALQLLYYLNIYVEIEKKKFFKDLSMWDIPHKSIPEQIQRLLLGIAIGSHKQKDIKEKNLDAELMKSVIEKETDTILLKNTLTTSIKSLREEQSQFPKEEWISDGVYTTYQEFLRKLQRFQNPNYSSNPTKKIEILQDINSFFLFRKDLFSNIEKLDNELKWAENPDMKLKLIEKIVTNNGKTKLSGSQEDKYTANLFKSKDEEDTFFREYKQLLDFLENYLAGILNKWRDKLSKSIESLLQNYFDIDNDKLDIRLEINPWTGDYPTTDRLSENMEFEDIHSFVKFNIFVMTSRGNLTENVRYKINPRQYLNTFRFKLFCVALKIALSCFVKETFEINYPIVIDDVFDSSDFDNRLHLKQFIRKVVTCHDDLLPENKYSLQIIFFTQDDLIADQIHKGLISIKGAENVKFGRIYDYHEMRESDKKKLSLDYAIDDKEEYNYMSIEDNIG